MAVEEKGTRFCNGGGRGSGWVVRMGGSNSIWWDLRWFNWWVVGFMVVVIRWWVFGGWIGLCGGFVGGGFVVVVAFVVGFW